MNFQLGNYNISWLKHLLGLNLNPIPLKYPPPKNIKIKSKRREFFFCLKWAFPKFQTSFGGWDFFCFLDQKKIGKKIIR
jgi:hypothetical protein